MAKRVKLLAFDTSSSHCSVAFLDTDKTPDTQITSIHKIVPKQQGQLILPLIEALLAASSVTLNQLDAVAYGCGPGSFTGIRIANSVAQGIGLATKCHIISISCLAAIAQAAYLEQQWTYLLVALDAHMGDVYWARYVINSQGYAELEGAEEVCAPEKVNFSLEKTNWVGVGDGWEKYGEKFIERMTQPPQSIHSIQRPTAEAILSLSRIKFDQHDWKKADEAVPIYLQRNGESI
jgi:tRNA threonylcarbamoyladenosine biosynthesis protein TsaB